MIIHGRKFVYIDSELPHRELTYGQRIKTKDLEYRRIWEAVFLNQLEKENK